MITTAVGMSGVVFIKGDTTLTVGEARSLANELYVQAEHALTGDSNINLVYYKADK